MGAGYSPILWNKNKKIYDRGIAIFCIGYLVFFIVINLNIHPDVTLETLIIRAFGSLALILLHIILVIGPLSRLDSRFLVLLYNRRHLGVTMFFISLIHGAYTIANFHTLGNENPLLSVLTSNSHYLSFLAFPFELFGIFALTILSLMAFTSHDFWLKNLTPGVWKRLHMMVYLAYVSLIFHVLLGAIQNERSSWGLIIISFGVVVTSSLHILAAIKERKADKSFDAQSLNEGWLEVGLPDEIEDKKAKTVISETEKIAVFRNGSKFSAISNICRHQGGPLSEGMIVDDCITCPWHGYQYYAHNGCSPPPFTEKVETYDLRLTDGLIFVKVEPNAPGTEVEPLEINT